jgi:hypothetical protein
MLGIVKRVVGTRVSFGFNHQNAVDVAYPAAAANQVRNSAWDWIVNPGCTLTDYHLEITPFSQVRFAACLGLAVPGSPRSLASSDSCEPYLRRPADS